MKQDRLKLALICFDNPFLPPSEGGKKGMMSRIKSLLYLDKYDIDIYLHNKRAEGFSKIPPDVKAKTISVKQYQMKSGLRIIFEKYPICVNKRFVVQCTADLMKEKYDIAIYEGEQVAAYRLENVIKAKHHILYMHDIESEYRAEIARSLNNPLLKIANKRESERFITIENNITEHFDQLWFVSKDECEHFCKLYNAFEKGTYFPFPAITFNRKICGTDKYKRLLYVGDMTVKHNALSMIWFTEKVFSRIKSSIPDAELILIGRINEKDKKKLISSGATVKGYVEDLDQEYKDAACVVCPVLYGAGVKVKTIDALAMGQIVITNSKGIEGTELENGNHLFVSDTVDGLASICIDVLKNRKQFTYIAEQGLAFVKKYHSVEYQAELIDSKIRELKYSDDNKE